MYLQESVFAMLNQLLFSSGEEIKSDRKKTFEGGHDQTRTRVLALCRSLVFFFLRFLFLKL